MDFFVNLWNSPSRYVLIVIGVIMIGYIIGMPIFMRRKKKSAEDYLISNPTAVKVFIVGVTKGTLTVISVNDAAPHTFYEQAKQGFFLLPGENTIEAQYSWTRPGLMHKTVTTTIGPNKIKVAAEPQKTYHISYDKSAEQYDFVEV